MAHPLRASATQLAAAIAAGELTSRALVDRTIEAIQTVNPALNAMVAERFAAARAEADTADAATFEKGERPPFHGVPFTVKEAIALKGMPHTSGSTRRQGMVADEDATIVARIRAAGGIPLGVTNVPELCLWMESDNDVYGRTNNPYDTKRTPGGSSGGEGALIGAGASPFGVGSDIGGSIRMPAFFNGVFGHKPTGGMNPNTGQYPTMTTKLGNRYLTTGILCRRAEDLYPLNKLIAGADGKDPGCTSQYEIQDPREVDLSGLRVLNIPTSGGMKPSFELRGAQKSVARHLKRLGATVETVRLPALKDAPLIWGASLAEESVESFGNLLGQGERFRPIKELGKRLRGTSRITAVASLTALGEDLMNMSPKLRRHYVAKGRALREELLERLGDDGVLLYPSYPRTAPRHGWPMLRQLTGQPGHQYPCILNILELPVTQVPLGLDLRGLPLGVQVGAGLGNDHLTMAVALELETAFGGWVPPKMAC
mgnify:CR=1 FL=1